MDTAIAKKEETALANNAGGIGMEGIEGISMSDLPMPYVKLVHPTTKKADLSKVGQWLHTGKNEYKESMAIVILFAKHGKITDFNDETIENDCMKVLAVDLEDLENPFAMTLSGGGWFAFMKLMAAMKQWKISKPWTRVIILGSDRRTSKDGKNEYTVPTINMSDPLTAEDLAQVEKLRETFKGRTDFQEEEEGHTASGFAPTADVSDALPDNGFNFDDVDLDGDKPKKSKK